LLFTIIVDLTLEWVQMVIATPRPSGIRNSLFMGIYQCFRRDERGSAAIEFAFVGPPFLLLILAIIELGMTLVTQSVLDGAARDAARLIRTGQIQTQGSPIGAFQTQLCSDMSSLMSVSQCNSNVIFEVQVFSNFGSVSFTPCTRNANQTGTGTACNFSPGTGGQIIGVQASYPRRSSFRGSERV
jgi:Flp pilus assembly protein TadG